MSPEQTAKYIAELSGQLAKLAKASRLETLEMLLNMIALETQFPKREKS